MVATDSVSGSPDCSGHISVLAGPAIELLNVRADGTYVDCTVGAGGHSELIAERIGKGRLICLDRDPNAIAISAERLASFPCVRLIQSNYSELNRVISELDINKVDGVLIDAGLSSMQIDNTLRGFSFQEDGPLDMRMDTTRGMTAGEYLASVSEAELASVLKEYGDVRPAKRLAAAIIEQSRQRKLETTRQLADVIIETLHFVKGVPVEMRTVFQAIRIAVNDEIEGLESALEQAIDLLNEEGRLVCISFHSGEDRIAKNVMRNSSRKTRELHPDGRLRKTISPRTRLLTPKPILPTHEEVLRNPRAHSAKLRAVERISCSGPIIKNELEGEIL